jgi:two-component system copper resistance phosphate regulon response regulator CusR
MRVLVVEDYSPLRDSLRSGLTDCGYAVDATHDGEEALWYAQNTAYDLVVLDLMLPGLSGMDVLQRMRGAGNTAHVLVLTARDAVADRVAALDLGADDYVVKPFAFDELRARLRALVRRRYDRRDPILRIADLEIDTVKRTARRGGVIALSAREYALLEYMAHRPGEVITRDELWDHVYDFAAERGSNVLDVYIGYLRRKIDSGHACKLIHTRRGLGYVLGART